MLRNIWVVVKIRVTSWVLKKYGTYYLGYPKRGPNFENHPKANRASGSKRPRFEDRGS